MNTNHKQETATRVTYLKRGDEVCVWIAEHQDLTLKIGSSDISEKTVIICEDRDELMKELEQHCRKKEQEGFEKIDNQVNIEIQYPVSDLSESRFLLRYTSKGISDAVLLNNDEHETLKMFRTDNPKHADYNLEKMEFSVNLTDHDSLKKMLKWQVDNFDLFAAKVREQCGVSYGYMNSGIFMTYESDEYEAHDSELFFYKAAAQHTDLRPLIAEFVGICGKRSKIPLRDDETPLGAWAVFELAMADKRYLYDYIDFCNAIDIRSSNNNDRFNIRYAKHVPQLIIKWGFDKDDDLLMDFIAAQTVPRDDLSLEEGISDMMNCGLNVEVKNPEFAEKLFEKILKRSIYVNGKIFNGTRLDLLARNLSMTLDIIFGLEIKENDIISILMKFEREGKYPEFIELCKNNG